MRRYGWIGMTAAMLLVASVAHADPWVAYGQTLIGPGQLHVDPVPNNHGGMVHGAVTTWPYVVPAGKVLVITGYGVEGNPTSQVIFPFLGPLPAGAVQGQDSTYAPWWDVVSKAGLYSVAGAHGAAVTGFRFKLTAGTEVHVGLINAGQWAMVHGWFLQGELVDAEGCGG